MTNSEKSDTREETRKTESREECAIRMANDQLIKMEVSYIDAQEDFINYMTLFVILVAVGAGVALFMRLNDLKEYYLATFVFIAPFLVCGFCFVIFAILVSTSNMRKLGKLQKMLKRALAAAVEQRACD
ncbi:MAG: hypothetical protein ACRYFY_14750 [Janthinobacterium lividum]